MESQAQVPSVLLIGVNDSGKSNFLFRFWLALDSGKGILTKDGLPADLDYLKTGADHLLKGEFAPHTPHDVRDATEIPFRSASSSASTQGSLVVPDLPGEQIVAIYQTRRWSHEWENRIGRECGILLFVRVDSKELIAPIDWLTCPLILGTTLPNAAAEKDSTNKSKPPTQVVMVDWLQFLRTAFTECVAGAFRPRVGIVVAAWDLAPTEQKAAGPAAWVKSNLPLLAQFIEANDDRFQFQYFGISVASGDLSADPEFAADYRNGNPRIAGEVVHSLKGGTQTSTDMTLPVAWALGIGL